MKRMKSGRKEAHKDRKKGEQRKYLKSGITQCEIMRVSRRLTGSEISPHCNCAEVSTRDEANKQTKKRSMG